MPRLDVNLDLVRKYNVPGPRYTSYPTAPHFSETIGWEDVKNQIVINNETKCRDLSLYFHLPFCKSLCWFCGCTNVITQDQSRSARYLDYLHLEWERVIPLINHNRKVAQWHLGGGSPTFLLPDEIKRLAEMVRSQFDFANGYEASVEIDPRTLTEEKMRAFTESGFNRISIGIQDLNPLVQQAVHRIQPNELNLQALEWAHSFGIKSINVDLIYGLPFQTVTSFEKTLDEILKLKPNRFAIFNYAHVPWIKKAQNALTPIPAEEKLAILKMMIEKLTDCGYIYIGMDHFALEDDELAIAQRNKTLQRNFQGYSTHAKTDIYAFGMSSISQTDSAYWQNEKDLKNYYELLDTNQPTQRKGYILTDDDKIRHETIMRLMCDLSFDYAEMSNRLQVPFTEYFSEELSGLDDLEKDGLLTRCDNGLKVSDLGRLFIRNIAMRFDAYLKQDQLKTRFSKTV